MVVQNVHTKQNKHHYHEDMFNTTYILYTTSALQNKSDSWKNITKQHFEIVLEPVNPSTASNVIFLVIYVNNIAADALALYIARSSVAMLLIVWLLSWGLLSLNCELHPSSVEDYIKYKQIYHSLGVNLLYLQHNHVGDTIVYYLDSIMWVIRFFTIIQHVKS